MYVEPTEGSTATVIIDSLCTRRAEFFVQINRTRTETYGCNQTAQWRIPTGEVDLVVQVEEANFAVSPIAYSFPIEEGQCAHFMLRQSDTYELEVIDVGACR